MATNRLLFRHSEVNSSMFAESESQDYNAPAYALCLWMEEMPIVHLFGCACCLKLSQAVAVDLKAYLLSEALALVGYPYSD
jgi:hypothetical protein